MADTEDVVTRWVSPSIRVKYGPYFRTDSDEEQKIVATVQTALGAGKPPGVPLITRRMGIEKIASVFGIDNIDAIETALDEAKQQEVQATEAQKDSDHKRRLEITKESAKATPPQVVQPKEESSAE